MNDTDSFRIYLILKNNGGQERTISVEGKGKKSDAEELALKIAREGYVQQPVISGGHKWPCDHAIYPPHSIDSIKIQTFKQHPVPDPMREPTPAQELREHILELGDIKGLALLNKMEKDNG